MARPRKSGLDYFPFDVDFFSDEKVVCIGGEFGVKGELTMIRLLCAVYRNGYFILWNENLKYKLKREMDGVSAELLDQIVQALVKRGFFDEALFNSDSVLTSEGIQRRYFEASKFRQRDQALPYLLITPSKNYAKNNISQWETPISQTKSAQIKRNKNKISSDEDNKPSSPPPFNEKSFLIEFFGENDTDPKRAEIVERLSISLGFPDKDRMKASAAEILQEWSIRRHVPKDWEDAAAHLVSTLRKKVQTPQNNKTETKKCATRNNVKTRVDELDRQTEQRRLEDQTRNENKESPDSLIRRMGYDPAKVSLAQVFNPNWRKNNPPESFTNQQSSHE